MNKIILKNGLIAGVISIGFMMFGVFTLMKDPNKFEPNHVLGFTGMILGFTFIFIGIKQYRDQINSGKITFLEALKIGSLIALIASCVYVGVWLIEYYCFYPDFMDKYSAYEINQVHLNSELSTNEVQKKLADIDSMKESYKNPVMVILWTFLEILPLGIVAAAISALFLKRRTVKLT